MKLLSCIHSSRGEPRAGDGASAEKVESPRASAKALVSRMARNADYFEKRTLTRAALRVGVENARKIADNGVKIEIVRLNPNLGAVRSYKAAYAPRTKKLSIGDARLSRGTATHEMAHALDHALASDPQSLRSVEDPRLKALYAAYEARASGRSLLERLRGRHVWSSYARANAQEYLAEGVRVATHPLLRVLLEKKDPGLAQYVRELIACELPPHEDLEPPGSRATRDERTTDAADAGGAPRTAEAIPPERELPRSPRPPEV